MKNTTTLIQIVNGTRTVKNLEDVHTIWVQKGGRYKVVESTGATESLASNVVVIRKGSDLYLSYADNKEIVLRGFYDEGIEAVVELPSDSREGIWTLDADVEGEELANEGGELLYAHGNSKTLLQITATQPDVFDALREQISAEEENETWSPDENGGSSFFWWAGLGLAGAGIALAFSEKEEAATPKINDSDSNNSEIITITGMVSAGPVITEHGLSITAYKADGTELASDSVNADGSYTLNITSNHVGLITLRVTDANDGADYLDEGTGVEKDLSGDLRAVTALNGSGSYTVQINPVTELASVRLGMDAGDNGNSQANLDALNISLQDVEDQSALLAKALGLDGVDLITETPMLVVNADSTSNSTNANAYGRILATLSGAEENLGLSTIEIIAALKQEITEAGDTTEAGKAILFGGANAVDDTLMVREDLAELLNIDETQADILSSISAISASDGTEGAPDVALYSAANVQGVTDDNLEAINSVVASLPREAIDTQDSIQLVVDAYMAVLAATSGGTIPTQSDFEALGITGVTESNLAAVQQALLNAESIGSSVDSLSELQAVVNAALTITSAPSGTHTVTISNDTGAEDDRVTNEAAVKITLALESALTLAADETLQVSADGTNWVHANGSGTNWETADNSVNLEVGNGNITARITDTAGNFEAVPLSENDYILDTSAPATTISIDSISQDTGVAGDFITNDTDGLTLSATLSAALQSGEVLEYSTDGANWSDITNAVSGTAVSYADAGLTNTATVQMRITDVAGNSGAVASQLVTVDVSAPATTISIDSISQDTGVTGDFITNDTDGLTLSATLSAALQSGEVLEYSTDGANWSDITNAVSGTAVSYADAGLTNTATVQMRITDVAGNSGAVASQLVTVDVSAPATTISIDSISQDTGVAGDFITNDTDGLTLSATLSTALQSGEVLEYSTDGANWSDITNAVSGTAVSYADAGLTNTATVQMRITDVAGNSGAVASQLVTVDVSAPATTISIDSISQDTGVTGDFITNDTDGLTLSATLSTALQSGEVLEYSTDGANWSDITNAVSGTAVSYADAGLTNTATVQMRITDVAGNSGAVASQLVTVDVSAPATTISIDSISQDTGVAGDFITNDTDGLTLSATLSAALQSGEVLEYSTDGANWSDITNDVSGTAVSYADAGLTNTATVQMRITDVAGNSGAVASQLVTVDVSAPATTISIDSISQDTGVTGDFITNDTDGLTLSATLSTALQSGEVLEYSTDGANWSDITNAVSGTAVSYADAGLTNTATVQMRITDVAGNSGAVASQLVTVDTSAPATTISIDSISQDTGVAGDFITNDTDGLTLSATLSTALQSGEVLEYSTDGANWSDITNAVSGTAVSYADAGLTNTATVQMRITDVAGNSGAVASQLVTVDVSAPATTISIDSISQDTGVAGDFITNDTDGLTLSATLSTALQSGEVLEYSTDGANWSDITNAVSGTAVSYADAGLTNTATVQMRITDVAGNSGAVASQLVTVDVSAPATTISIDSISQDTGVAGDFITNDTDGLTLSATLSAALQSGEVLEYSTDGANWSDITNAVSGTAVSYADAGLTNTATVQMRITDVAGNSGAVASQLVTVDVSAPTTTISIDSISQDTGVAGDFITNDTDGLTLSATLSAALQSGEVLEYSTDGANWSDITNAVSGTAVSYADAGLTNTATVQMRITDVAGNSGAVASQLVTVDTSAPATTISIDSISQDTGVAGDFITNDTDGLTLSATLSAALQSGEVLEYSTDGANWSDITNAVSGTAVSYADAGLTNTATVQMRITDVAGNSGAVASQLVTVDTSAPATTISIDSISQDTGVAGDFITNDTDGLTLSATLSAALQSGEVLEYSTDGANWSDITNAVSGTAVSYADAGLTNTATVQMRITDVAGNSGAVASQLVTVASKGFRINGEAADDQSGWAVSSAGDVNGDGLTDLIVGSQNNKSYVVFGKADGTMINLSDVAAGTDGFVVNGEGSSGKSGYSVSSAGDVNNDGFDDLIIGDINAGLTGEAITGKSYIVFGKSNTNAVNLSDIANGSDGFSINGESADDKNGWSVSSAGDMNGDGFDDIIIGTRHADPGGRNMSGKSYIVFGKENGTSVDLSDITAGVGGFVVNGDQIMDASGSSVSSAGDVNGDGLDDLIIGAPWADPNGNISSGRSYVVFGKTDGTSIELSDVLDGTGGFAINGENTKNWLGASVSSAGDINGDGLDDVIVGANGADLPGMSDAGRSYVVFGKTDGTTVDLDDVVDGTSGFVINGEATGDNSGRVVSSAGDVNGDGIDDLIVGAHLADPNGNSSAGKSYVIFGNTTNTSAINLSDIAAGTGGFVINGEAAGDKSGYSISSAGDVNGDGLDDLIVGANWANHNDNSAAGKSYVIFGKTDTAAVSLANLQADSLHTIDYTGNTSDNVHTGTTASEIILGGEGDDTLTGAGGTDVLLGGAGDDTIVINASNVAALENGFDTAAKLLARVNGGGGEDTLKISGGGVTLDLTALASNRIENIEIIDIKGQGNNTLEIDVNDVLDMGSANLFNSSNGWNSLGAEVSRHQLVVAGNSGDTVDMNGSWTDTGTTVNNGGQTYDVYNTNEAQLLVDVDIIVI